MKTYTIYQEVKISSYFILLSNEIKSWSYLSRIFQMIFAYYKKRNKDEKLIVKSISIQQKYSPVWISKAIFHKRIVDVSCV